MLYQLSYPGTARREGQGAPVYSQAGGLCPPAFAFGYGAAGPASAVPSNCWEITLIDDFADILDGDEQPSRSHPPSPASMPSYLCMGLFSIFYYSASSSASGRPGTT